MDNFSLHHGTPKLAVIDPRSLAVRSVTYWRGESGQTPQARVTRQGFDAAGRGVEQWDARLSAPALRHCFSLTGRVVATDSVDAGWRVALFGQAAQVLSGWDGRGTRQETEYDTLLRPLVVMEQARVVERFEYGTCGPEANPGNQCGRLIRHDDPAGTRHMPEYDLLGLALNEISHFLAALDPPDWPQESSARDGLLEPAPGFESRWTYNPLGDLLNLTDAKAHRRHFTYTVAGQLKDGWLQPANTASPGQCLVHDICYNPGGKVERETAGNGVVTEAQYALDDGRLLRLCAGLPNAAPVQDLRYTVDPGGNIVQIDDHALPIRYYKNQRIDAQCTYGYDTLGQLTHATGWEAEKSSFYPFAPYQPSTNPDAVVNYREEYDYDATGNMIELRHLGAQPFTRRWAVATNSNRSLLEGDQPPDFVSHFDANGNLQFLQRGQTLAWDLRNQLSRVSPVVREGEDDDTEIYVYGGGGKRLRKVRTALAAARTVIAEVRYLPGLEIHHRPGGKQHEVLDLAAGRNRVNWLHGADVPEHSLRYHLTDHLGSGTLELDEQAKVQSREEFYPFGGTAWEDHSDQSGAYKTIRYSGKERDATGLYYYGYRYFAPWLCRWINPDPAGAVDGLNVYCFVGNSPVGHVDVDGLIGSPAGSLFDEDSQASLSSTVEAMARSSTLTRIDINEGDFDSQASAWSLSDVLAIPRPEQEALMLEKWSTLTQPSSSPVAGPSSTNSLVEDKRYPCPICEKTFSQRSNRSKHMRTHTGDKPFKCEWVNCFKAFSQRQDLDAHMRSHTGEKKYGCLRENCNAAYGTSGHLARHMRMVHSTKVQRFPCPMLDCEMVFESGSERDQHVTTHPKIKSSCPYLECASRINTKASLRSHLRRKHGGKLPE